MRNRATELGRTYDFNSLLMRQRGGGGTVLPPVIVEMREASEIQEGGRTQRVADTVYEIVQQARLVQAAPLWQTYLDMEACCSRAPEAPSEPLPRSDAERELWRRYVTEGWNEGLTQSTDIFQSNMRRLQRDFVGMTRYARLVEEGKVSPPVVADTNMGVTGTGQNMRVNDTVIRITRDPRLNVGPGRDWRPAVSDVPVGEGAVPTGEPQPQPRTAEQVRGGRIVPGSRPGRMPSAAVTPSDRQVSDTSDMPSMSAAPVRSGRGAPGEMPDTANSTNGGGS